MDLGLDGTTILVTGGAKGIGEAIVRELAAEGAIPVIVDRDEAASQALRNDVLGVGLRCEVVVADLEDPDACRRAVEEGAAFGKGLAGLVNNAGINDKVGLLDGSTEDFLHSLRRNLLHYFEVTRHAVPHLKTRRGAIVNVASKVAMTGQGGTSGYAASKGGILALTREWAVDLLPFGIRVNAIVPAEVMTPLYRQWLDTFPDPEAKLDAVRAKIPLGRRMTTPQEIAASAVFLLSDRAGHITGQHLVVDGGYMHLDRGIT